MPNCALRNCKSRYGKAKEENYNLFSFPPVESEVRIKWIKFVQIERNQLNWQPSAASKLCSKHFKSEDIYYGKTGRAIIKKGSVPVKCENGVTTVADTGIAPVDVFLSDSEPEVDTPKMISLKVQVHKLQLKKIQHQVKIDKLRNQNYYLRTRLQNMRKFVRYLKKKFGWKKGVVNSLKTTAESEEIDDELMSNSDKEMSDEKCLDNEQQNSECVDPLNLTVQDLMRLP